MRVTPEQLRKALADMFRDPETRGLIYPYLARPLPIQGGDCGSQTNGQIAKFCDGAGTVDASVITELSEDIGIGTTDRLSRLTVKAKASFDINTVTIANQSTGVVGSGTLFTKDMGVGDRITVFSQTRTVVTITDNTHLTVDIAFTADEAGQTMNVLPSILRADDSSGSPKLLVTNIGQVGIGTAAPRGTLDLVSAFTTIKLQTTSATAGQQLWSVYVGDDSLRFRVVNDADTQDAPALPIERSGLTVTRTLLYGSVGIGTTSPSALLDVVGDVRAKAGSASTVPLTAQGAASQTGNLQQWKNSSGTVLASVTKDGSLVLRGTETKQSSGGGGPELITALGPNDGAGSHDKVVLWSGLSAGTGGSADTEARFLFSLRGFLEWGPGGTGDQDIALYRNGAGGISIGNFFTDGPPVHSTDAFRVNAPSKNPPGAEGTAVLGVATGKTAGVRVRGRRSFTLGTGQTVATTATSATVVGTNTQFMSDIVAGDIITIVDTGETKTVKSVTDDTHLVADTAFGSSDTSSNMAVASFSGFAGTESFQTTAAVKTTDATDTTIAIIPLDTPRAYSIVARVVGRKSDGSAWAFLSRAALVHRESGGSGIDGTSDMILIQPGGASGWLCKFALSGSGTDLFVQVTGNASVTVHWAATIEYQSVSTNT